MILKSLWLLCGLKARKSTVYLRTNTMKGEKMYISILLLMVNKQKWPYLSYLLRKEATLKA